MELEIVAGTYDCMIKGFSIDALTPEEKGLRPRYHEKDHVGCVRAVASGGSYLASGGTDETIKLYNMKKHREIGTLIQHKGSITWLTFHRNTHLFSASEDGTICIWKCGSWDCLHTLMGHRAAVTCFSVHPSGKLALSVSKDRTVRTWDLITGHVAFIQRLPQVAELVVWGPIGDQYSLAFEKSITVYDVESGAAVTTSEVGKHINCLLYVQEDLLAVGSDHHHVQLVSTTSGETLANLEGHTNRVKGLALAPGGELLFSASSDGTVKAWRITQPQSELKCISSVETGSRLTCLTLVHPESLIRELKQPLKRSSTQDTGDTPGNKTVEFEVAQHKKKRTK